MSKYNNVKYDDVRKQIKIFIDKGFNLEETLVAGYDSKKEVLYFLESNKRNRNWDITIEDWENLVQIEYEQLSQFVQVSHEIGLIINEGEENKFDIPQNRDSTWQRFKRFSLIEKSKFDSETINNIENDIYRIVKNISVETNKENPIKGLVIGGVQSGKTTNIAALMAISSDYGFNMFIILSGMIENLRVQNELRIGSLLEVTNGKRAIWKAVPRIKESIHSMQNLYGGSNKIYTVSLKQKDRLKQLINWLQADVNIAKKLKILIIDDESDLAGVNTSKDVEERKTINRLIVNLVHSKRHNGKEYRGKFEAINYIGYTATPYANILSEAPNDKGSLYPKNFINILSKSNRHLGPRQIFGEMGTENDGLDIVRKIEDTSEIVKIKGKLKEINFNLPKELKESIAYFIGATASLRKHNFKKPVSMLVQVSHEQKYHRFLKMKIGEWLNKKEDVKKEVELIWEKERNSISFKDFKGKILLNSWFSLKPHKYKEISDEVEVLLNKIGPIKKDMTDDSLIYHEGIHVVVDNSDKSLEEYGIQNRLVYPMKDEDNMKTPGFLVIGGDTLSRGLTLEGLVSTYFLRTPGAADTLTQMGRWFGYRINYELYPRIWITEKAKEQFKYISTLEEELRTEIRRMMILGTLPSEVGPKIKYMPQYIEVTSKNKRYAQKSASFDFSGFSTQTYLFNDDVSIQKENIEITEKFINSLGKPKILKHSSTNHGVIWENIPFNIIKDNLLAKFHFNQRIKVLNTIDIFLKWVEKSTKEKSLDNWNVILGGLGSTEEKNTNWHLKEVNYNMVSRTKKTKNLRDGEIDIGVLRSPSDLFIDIDRKKYSDKVIEQINEAIKSGNRSDYSIVREKIGLEKTPQLVIYKIRKDSKVREYKEVPKYPRVPLGIDSDLIGLYLSIPGKGLRSNTTYITVDIDDLPINDFEGEDL